MADYKELGFDGIKVLFLPVLFFNCAIGVTVVGRELSAWSIYFAIVSAVMFYLNRKTLDFRLVVAAFLFVSIVSACIGFTCLLFPYIPRAGGYVSEKTATYMIVVNVFLSLLYGSILMVIKKCSKDGMNRDRE